MAEQSETGDKTEDPTEKRIADAIERGNLPISREAATFAALAALCVNALIVIPNIAGGVTQLLGVLLDRSSAIHLDTAADMTALLHAIVLQLGMFVGPVLLLMIVAGLAAAAAQGSLSFHPDCLEFDLSRISPINGFTRLFGQAGLVEFLKSLTKLLLVVAAVLILAINRQNLPLQILMSDATDLPHTILRVLVELLLLLFAASTVLMVADLLYARFAWREKLRMSRDELKREVREWRAILCSRLACDRSQWIAHVVV